MRLLLLSALILAGCAQHHCRRPPDTTQPVAVVAPEGDTVPIDAISRKVRIYKYDGSLQCGQGKPVSLEQMATELKGIKIFTSQKKSDGLMHIQVCGSPTGMANVFEILESDLAKAEKSGFKRWTFE